MKYKNWVWDLDGTLFDTYPNMTLAFSQALQSLGFEASYLEIHQQLKVSLSHAVNFYSQKFTLPSNFIDVFRSFEKEGSVEPFEWVESCLREVVQKGGKNFIWTHRDALTFEYLKTHQWMHYFSDVITSDMGFERKPSGDAMRYLLETHRLNKEETLMIGDRELDILGALDAGVEGVLYSPNTSICSTKAIFIFESYSTLKNSFL